MCLSSLVTVVNLQTIQIRGGGAEVAEDDVQSVLSTDTYTTPVNTHSAPLPQLFRSLCHVYLDTGKHRPRSLKRGMFLGPLRESTGHTFSENTERFGLGQESLQKTSLKLCVPSFLKQNQCVFLPKCTLKLIQICCEPGEKSFLSFSFKLQPNIR